jgi:hypothetical protein
VGRLAIEGAYGAAETTECLTRPGHSGLIQKFLARDGAGIEGDAAGHDRAVAVLHDQSRMG